MACPIAHAHGGAGAAASGGGGRRRRRSGRGAGTCSRGHWQWHCHRLCQESGAPEGCRTRSEGSARCVVAPRPAAWQAGASAAPSLTPARRNAVGLLRAPSRGRSLVILEDRPRPHPLHQREQVVPSRAAADAPRLAHLRMTARAEIMIYRYLLRVVRSIGTADMHRLGLTSGAGSGLSHLSMQTNSLAH